LSQQLLHDEPSLTLLLWPGAVRSKSAKGSSTEQPSGESGLVSRLALGIGFGGGLLLYSYMTLTSEPESEDKKDSRDQPAEK
jgi:hypothetical protein